MPIKLSDSAAYNLEEVNLVYWIIYMLRIGRFRSAMMREPPCTTFSPAAHCLPFILRTSGLWPAGPKNFPRQPTGLAICFAAGRYNRPCALEQPFLSKMAWLSAWRFLVQSRGWKEAKIASCAFGSPHLKMFRLVTSRRQEPGF